MCVCVCVCSALFRPQKKGRQSATNYSYKPHTLTHIYAHTYTHSMESLRSALTHMHITHAWEGGLCMLLVLMSSFVVRGGFWGETGVGFRGGRRIGIPIKTHTHACTNGKATSSSGHPPVLACACVCSFGPWLAGAIEKHRLNALHTHTHTPADTLHALVALCLRTCTHFAKQHTIQKKNCPLQSTVRTAV